jgi:glycosyltransferase involved in cell wall biosynthesis
MSSAPDKDIRVSKESLALKKAGYGVDLLYWDREGRGGRSSGSRTYDNTYRLRLKAPEGVWLALFLPVWWGYIFGRLLFRPWDVVHALNFHSILPSLLAARLKRKRVIYEIIDFYEWRAPGFIRGLFLRFDKLMMRLADAVIVADEAQIEGIGGIANPNVTAIYDSPPDTLNNDDSRFIGHLYTRPFTLFYAGALYRNRQLHLDRVFEAIKGLDDVKLVVAGYGDLVPEILEWSERFPDKVEYIGRLKYADVIRRGLRTHLFFVLRDDEVPTNRFTCGSTIFNAMICGKPVLVNLGTSTTQKVTEENCGIAVNPRDAEEIKRAIVKLRDFPPLCRELGANARRAYEQRYGWAIMSKRLIDLYDNLTREVNHAG